MKPGLINWTIFTALCLIWGSSFIMMKVSLESLSAFQVASLRLLASGMVFLPLVPGAFKRVPRGKIPVILLSGLLGSFFPAFLFCMAQEHVESSLAGSLNSLTPVFVIILGAFFFRFRPTPLQVAGILVSFTGSFLLYAGHPGFGFHSNFFHIAMIILATLAYGLNVNLVNRYLLGIPSRDIAVIALFLISIPSFFILFRTGYFSLELTNPVIARASFWAVILGILATSLASVIFYVLIKQAGPVFSSMVTYGIPVVANIWGIVYGESVGWWQAGCLFTILAGVFMATRSGRR